MKINRLYALFIITIAPLLVPSVSSADKLKPVQPAQDRPNIVFVLVDDHAFEAISAYGSFLKEFAKTPNIDRLAKEGMRFDNFVCGNSICSPSRASILTGQYSNINGVKGIGASINLTSPWYPEELQKVGYQTMGVGKWHLGGEVRGYDKHMFVKKQGKYFNPKFSGSEGEWEREGYSTDVYTDIALDWLETRDKDKPFLLSLQFKAPHFPYDHAERYNDLLADVTIPEPPTLYEDIRNCNSNIKKMYIETSKFHMTYSGGGGSYYSRNIKAEEPNKMWDHDPEDENDRIRVSYQHMIHKYIRCITGNDDNLKRVLDYLDTEGLTENTIVIYAADQGYWLGQHGLYDKRLILESSVRMPFIIRYPKMIEPGTVNTDICVNVDIAPTLLTLAGAKTPDSMQGHSMVPLLEGKTPKDWQKASIYTYWAGSPKHYGLRTDRYTYAKINGSPSELFDRQIDPDQVNNVAGNPEYSAVIETCEKELNRLLKEVKFTTDTLPDNTKKRKKERK